MRILMISAEAPPLHRAGALVDYVRVPEFFDDSEWHNNGSG